MMMRNCYMMMSCYYYYDDDELLYHWVEEVQFRFKWKDLKCPSLDY